MSRRPGVTTTTITGPADRRRRRRIEVLDIFRRTGKTQTRPRLLVTAAVLDLFAVVLVIALNVGGRQTGGGPVLAPDTHLLAWTDYRNVNGSEGLQSRPFTLYWFLNALCVRDGPGGPLEALQGQAAGQDFDWRRLDNQLETYMAAHYTCNYTSGFYEAGVAGTTSSEASSLQIRAGVTSSPLHSNATVITVTAGPCSSASLSPDDVPYALTGQPVFGNASFTGYLVAAALTALTWAWHFLPAERKRPGGSTQGSYYEGQKRVLLLLAKAGAALAGLAAAGLLTTGIGFVVGHTAASSGNNTHDMPSIAKNTTGLAVVWCAAASQLLACLTYCAAEWVRRPSFVASRSVVAIPSSVRQRPSSLPMYRPREVEPEDLEDLPPYQREDPLGSPPSIDGYSHGVSRRAECIQLDRTRSEPSGRTSPSPDYQATVEPASPLGSSEGMVSRGVLTALEAPWSSPSPPGHQGERGSPNSAGPVSLPDRTSPQGEDALPRETRHDDVPGSRRESLSRGSSLALVQ